MKDESISLIDELGIQKRKVDFNSYDFSVKELVSMVAEGIIDIAPEYQRQFRWEDERQSRLIESLLLGIPIPNIFMATNSDGSWEVIDGVQRITTIIRFMDNAEAKSKTNVKDNLTLTSLQKLPSFNKQTFAKLPHKIKLDFMLRTLKVTTLTDKSDLDVRFDLFERLNTGGIKLTSQEIRSCVFRGNFNEFVKRMAQNKDFLKATLMKEQRVKDGTAEEAVLRFFAFLHNYKGFKYNVTSFLNNYMAFANKEFDYEKNEKIFKKTFKELSKLEYGISKGLSTRRSSFKINFYEGVAVGAALVLQKKAKLNTTDFYTWVNDPKFIEATTGATNQPKMVQQRIEFCKEKFSE
ncbi:DUF262 domain-containing protein [Actinobacillus equuli subsp. equuli]|uniref:DUF262 domain-containing protein n=1 Tax=Actinobacillus equuli subsp. equuli TaxID=202947 RepID=A0A9X4G847_ACTEU|nr:DUF262 domain-containing protein [Actinobacillus equuli]MDE8035750.1 DUF262 domain-containing protein [Actinobacillus equuli subsp. equuli]